MTEAKPTAQGMSMAPLGAAEDFSREWGRVDLLTLPHGPKDRYVAGFASSERCVEQALRLRYEVFNLELDEGLATSAATGLDRDRFDDQMTHLVLLERDRHDIVGTYRLQAAGPARKNGGIYSAQEYDLTGLEPYLEAGVEVGRACLAAEHRTFRAMLALWLGLGAYMNLYKLRYLFGCCSLTSQDTDDGWRALRTIRQNGCLHPELFLPASSGYSCGPLSRETDVEDGYRLPKLFRTYLRLGAKVISEPAIDRDFGTVDFLVMMDGKEVALSRLDVLE